MGGAVSVALALVLLTSCGGSAGTRADGGSRLDAGPDGASEVGEDGGPDSQCADDGGLGARTVVISTTARKPRITTWSVNYWQWMPAYGDDVSGTDNLVAFLTPAILRVGGYNNDINAPNPFDDGALDASVAYARAIGAEPLIQVPLLADDNGQPPTPATAAAIVSYANVTMQYGIKYFSIGNEPDLYSVQGSPADATKPAIPGYTPAEFCTAAAGYVAAMKAVDPTIVIVGPELAYKYQAGNPDADWLTPILTGCGDLFDIISIHRYPFEAAQATLTAAAADPAAFRNIIRSVEGILTATGQGAKPLALTEMNIVYDATTQTLDASPGTVGAALWLADSLGTAIELGLWTSCVWNISDTDDWSLGLIGPGSSHAPRPSYYAYALYAVHFGPTLVQVAPPPQGVSVHASRNRADDGTQIIVINWNSGPAALELLVTGLAGAMTRTVTLVAPSVSIAAVEIADNGAAGAWTYGEPQYRSGSGPQSLHTLSTSSSGRGGGGTGVDASVDNANLPTTPTSCETDAAPGSGPGSSNGGSP
jgi:hypothetical protein